MFIKVKRGWEIPERLATPEHVFFNRRKFLVTGAAIGAMTALSACDEKQEAQAEADAAPAAPDPSAVALSVQAQRDLQARPRRDGRAVGDHLQQLLRIQLGQESAREGAGAAGPALGADHRRHGRQADADRHRRSDEEDAAGRAALSPSLRRDLVDGGAVERLRAEGTGEAGRAEGRGEVSAARDLHEPRGRAGAEGRRSIPGPMSRA